MYKAESDALAQPKSKKTQEIFPVKEVTGLSKALSQAAKAENQLTKATLKIVQVADGALAAFDQLDVLGKKKTVSGSSTSSGSSKKTTKEKTDSQAGKGAQAGNQETLSAKLLPDTSQALERLKGIRDAFGSLNLDMETLWQQTLDGLLASWVVTGTLITGNVGLVTGVVGQNLGALWEEGIQPVLQNISESLMQLWSGQIVPGFEGLSRYLAGLIAQAPELLKGFVEPVVGYFTTLLLPGATASFQMLQETAKALDTALSGVAAGIIASLEGITTFMNGVFSGDWQKAWDGIKTVFQGQWQGMLEFARGTVNAIISIINSMIKAATDGINYIIKQLNQISFDIPDWVPGIGGSSFGIHINPLTPYQIPRLATGAVIPPGAEFLAVLGDQRSGRNLEAPENLIRQIVREESAGQQMRLNISAKGSAGELVRWLRFEMERETGRQGTSLIKGGENLAVY